MLPHFRLTRRCRLCLFTPEQDDILSLLTHFIIPSITPRRCSIFTLQVSFRVAARASSGCSWLQRSTNLPFSLFPGHIKSSAETSGKLQDPQKQTDVSLLQRWAPPPPVTMFLLRREFMIGALSASLWQRSGVCWATGAVIYRPSVWSAAEWGVGQGGGGGLLWDLFPVKMMRSELKADTEPWS